MAILVRGGETSLEEHYDESKVMIRAAGYGQVAGYIWAVAAGHVPGVKDLAMVEGIDLSEAIATVGNPCSRP